MKKLLFGFLALYLILASGQCSPEVIPELVVSTDETPLPNFSNTGGSQTFEVTSVHPWEASSNQPWCTVSPTSGEPGTTVVTVTVAADNSAPASPEEVATRAEWGIRTATITITANGNERQITVTQEVQTPSPVITIGTQPAAETTVTQGSISGSISVSASVTLSATLSYQWYSNTSNSNTGGTAISGATNASFAIPATLAVGTYYYFCEVRATDGAISKRSNVAKVTVINVSSINYWDQSDLIKMQLKGNVKTVYDGTTITFDENGRIVSVETWDGNKRDYVYNDNGQLIDDGDYTYTYDTHGKYVLKAFYHWNESNMNGLVKNLKTITSKADGSTVLYTFEGNTLKIIEGEWIVEIAYEGNYPKIFERDEEVYSAKFAANGMFTEYYEALSAHFSRKYVYKQDDDFMLLDSKIENSLYNEQPVTSTTIYIYNDKKNVIKEVLTEIDGIVYETTYSYVYDSKGNWIKMTSSSNEAERVITYF